MNSLRLTLLLLGILTAIPTMLALAAGILGLSGILADIGPADNQRLGIQAFTFAAIVGTVSTVCLVAFYLVYRFDRRGSGSGSQTQARGPARTEAPTTGSSGESPRKDEGWGT